MRAETISSSWVDLNKGCTVHLLNVQLRVSMFQENYQSKVGSIWIICPSVTICILHRSSQENGRGMTNLCPICQWTQQTPLVHSTSHASKSSMIKGVMVCYRAIGEEWIFMNLSDLSRIFLVPSMFLPRSEGTHPGKLKHSSLVPGPCLLELNKNKCKEVIRTKKLWNDASIIRSLVHFLKAT